VRDHGGRKRVGAIRAPQGGRDGRIFEVGGYPYFNVVGDRCSVWQNRGVEEENA
jgi:hypothetical protein